MQYRLGYCLRPSLSAKHDGTESLSSPLLTLRFSWSAPRLQFGSGQPPRGELPFAERLCSAMLQFPALHQESPRGRHVYPIQKRHRVEAAKTWSHTVQLPDGIDDSA